MSSAHLQELLDHGGKGCLKALAQYAVQTAQNASGKQRLPAVWGPVITRVVEHILSPNVAGVKKPEDARLQYSVHLRDLIAALHDGCGRALTRVPLTFPAVDMLYQHLHQVLSDRRVGPYFALDYSHVLLTLLKQRKYGCWLRAEPLVGLCRALMRLLRDAAVSKATVGKPELQQTAVALSTLVTGYPRQLPAGLSIGYMDFSAQNIPLLVRQHPSLALRLLRGLNGVLRREGSDNVKRSRKCAADLSPVLSELWSGNDAARGEVVDFYRLQLKLHYAGVPPPLSDPLQLPSLWGLIYSAMSPTHLHRGMPLRTAGDGRTVALISLAADVAIGVTRADASTNASPGSTEAKRRRTAPPLETLLSSLSAGSDLSSRDSVTPWIRVLCTVLQKESSSASRVLTRQHVASALDSLVAGLGGARTSRAGDGYEGLLFSAVGAAASAVRPGSGPDREAAERATTALLRRATAEPAGQCASALASALAGLLRAARSSCLAAVSELPVFASAHGCSTASLWALSAAVQNGLPEVSDLAAEQKMLWVLSGCLTSGEAQTDFQPFAEAAEAALLGLLGVRHSMCEPHPDIEDEIRQLELHLLAALPPAAAPDPVVEVTRARRRCFVAAVDTLMPDVESAGLVPAASLLHVLTALRCRGVWSPRLTPKLHRCVASLMRSVAERWERVAAAASVDADRPGVATDALAALLHLHELNDGAVASADVCTGSTDGKVYAGGLVALCRSLIAFAETSVGSALRRQQFMSGAAAGAGSCPIAITLSGRIPSARSASYTPAGAAAAACLCAARAVTVAVRPSGARHDAVADALTVAATQAVSRVWEAAGGCGLHPALAVLLVSGEHDSESGVQCLLRLRSMLTNPENRGDDDFHRSVLQCMRLCIANLRTGLSGELADLIRDTVLKFRELCTKQLLSSAAKTELCRLSLVTARAVGDGPLFGDAVDTFLPLLSDGAQEVRSCACSAAPDLVGLFPAPRTAFARVSERLVPLLSSPEGSDAREATSGSVPDAGTNAGAREAVTAVVLIALRCSLVQDSALVLLLLTHAQEGFTERDFLEASLAALAERVGADSTGELVRWHMDHILREWLVAKRVPLARFPFGLLGALCFDDFVSSFMPALLPAALQSASRTDLLTRICEGTHLDETELLVEHLATVFGHAYLQYYVGDGSVARSICEGYIKTRVSDERLGVLLEGCIDGVLETFLRLESSESEPPLPRVSRSIVDTALRDFAALWGHEGEHGVRGLLSATPDRLFRLLLHVGAQVLDRRREPEYSRDRFAVLRALMERCGNPLLTLAPSFRICVHLCIEATGTVGMAAFISLAELCSAAAEAAPDLLVLHIPTIAARLVPLISAAEAGKVNPDSQLADGVLSLDEGALSQGTAAGCPGNGNEAAACLTRILEAAAASSACRRAASGALSPIPAASEGPLVACGALYGRLVAAGPGATRLSAYVTALTRQATAAGPDAGLALRLQVLRALSKHLSEPRAKRQVDADRGTAVRLTALLTQIATGGDDGLSGGSAAMCTELRLSAAAALIGLHKCGVGSGAPVDSLPCEALQTPTVPSCWSLANYLDLAKLRALRALADAVYGSSSVSMATAASTLRQCLSLTGVADLVRAAAQRHDRSKDDSGACLAADLEPFMPPRQRSGKRRRVGVAAAACVDRLTPACREAEQLLRQGRAGFWDPGSECSFDGCGNVDWAGRVAAALSVHAADTFLQECAMCCLVLPSVAAVLLPVAVVDLVCGGKAGAQGREGIEAAVGGALKDLVLTRAAEHPRPARLALVALLAVRMLLREDIRRSGMPRKGDAGSAGCAAGRVRVGDTPPLLQQVPLLVAARASLACGAPAAALDFAELALQSDNGRGGLVHLNDPWQAAAQDTQRCSSRTIDALFAVALKQRQRLPVESNHKPPQVRGTRAARACADEAAVRQLLVEVAASTRDQWLLEGACDGTTPVAQAARYSARPQDWQKAVIAEGTVGSENADLQIAKALRRGGVFVQPQAQAATSELSELAAEAAWQLSDWGPECRVAAEPQAGGGFHAGVLGALSGFWRGDVDDLRAGLTAATASAAQLLKEGGHRRLPEALARVAACDVLQRSWLMSFDEDGRRRPTPPDDAELTSSGILSDPSASRAADGFADLCSVVDALRPQVLTLMGRADLVPRAVLAAATNLGAAGRVDAALALLQRTPSRMAGRVETAAMMLQEAKMLHARGEPQPAVALLRRGASLLSPEAARKGPDAIVTQAQLLCQLGRWLGDSRAEPAPTVISEYLVPAARLMAHDVGANRGEVFYTLARYTDALYCALKRRESSKDAVLAQSVVEQHRQTLHQVCQYMENTPKMSANEKRQLSHHAGGLNALVVRATEAEQALAVDKQTFLIRAVKAYAVALESYDSHDTECVYRLLTLWLSSSDDSDVNHFLTGFFGRCELPHKFVCLSYQLVSRLSTSSSLFQTTLRVLVEGLTRRHPHHMLYHLSALAHGDVVPRKQRLRDAYYVDIGRVKAARKVLKCVAKNSAVSAIDSEMQELVKGYIEFAFHPVQKELDTTSQQLPDSLVLSRLRNLRHAVVTSYDVPVASDGCYDSAPRINGFEATFRTAGGLNLPKIIRCLGSDGRWYKQLVKGMDDLRQDAVIEQLFGLCNTVLRSGAASSRRSVHGIRTYKVVPLTPTSGVLAWVENTVTIGEWLTGGKKKQHLGAHARYHPRDILAAEARNLMVAAAGPVDKPQDPEHRIRTFASICDRFTPVMHRFFFEMHATPEQWLRARNNYTCSTAAAAMTGYVIGLGDRHSQNILIDTETGEIIHIDLGVAFEKGRLLPIPELVPFRLTRDTIDGMGACGTEGLFRQCCEATMELLREHKRLLATVVEVFVYDPLYNYSLDPARIVHNQEEFLALGVPDKPLSSDCRNADADLALSRVNEKLEGFDDGQYLSVEGQVAMLIKQASSLDTLALMYPGWAPWL